MEEVKNQENKKCHGGDCKCGGMGKMLIKILVISFVVFSLLSIGAAMGIKRVGHYNYERGGNMMYGESRDFRGDFQRGCGCEGNQGGCDSCKGNQGCAQAQKLPSNPTMNEVIVVPATTSPLAPR